MPVNVLLRLSKVAIVAAAIIVVVVMPLLVTAHANNIQLWWSIIVHLRLLKVSVEFVWVVGWFAK